MFINCDFKVNINGLNFEQSKSIKYLDVVLDEKLNLRANLWSLKSRLSRSCFVSSKLSYYFDVSTLKIVYYSLFYPHIQFCIKGCLFTWKNLEVFTILTCLVVNFRLTQKIYKIIRFFIIIKKIFINKHLN